MAYAVPEQWTQGEYPTAAKINKYKDALDATYALLGDYGVNPAVSRRIGTVQGFYFVHRNRWLTYRDAGTLQDPGGVGEDVSLPNTGNWVSYDLAQVEWLLPGKLYQVEGVLACWEDVDPI
jgi:hypothetical protein